jgi:hypothetical protein
MQYEHVLISLDKAAWAATSGDRMTRGLVAGLKGAGDRADWSCMALIGMLAPFVLLVGGGIAEAAPKTMNGYIGGSSGVNAGGFFTQPRDVVVYTAGTPNASDDKIFITEALDDTSRVQRFDAHGNFERMWGRNTVRPGASGNSGTGYEICAAEVSGAANCQGASVGSQKGEFDNPVGIAINQSTGHVYVMDEDNLRVQEFNLNGEFVRAWGWDVASEEDSGDTDPDAYEVCTTVCQSGAAGDGAGQLTTASANSLAVSPVAPHDIFVTDSGNKRVLQFAFDGSFRRGWGWGVDTGTDQFETCTVESACQAGHISAGAPSESEFGDGSPVYVAVDSAGIVYASDTNESDRLVRFSSDPGPVTTLDPLRAPSLLSTGRSAGLEFDSETDHLLVVREPSSGPTVVDEIADPSTDLPPVGPPNPSVTDVHTALSAGNPQSLGYNSALGNLYLTYPDLIPPPNGPFTGCTLPQSGLDCQGVVVLAESSGPLQASLEAPANVGTTTASLAGSLHVGGGVASYRFQVSRDGANWTDTSEGTYLSASTFGPVSTHVSDLEPATLYRVRLLATKQTGTSTAEAVLSSEEVFLTDAAKPVVTTLGSSNRTDTSVRLHGLADPQGSEASYRFEYGPANGSFDHHVPVPDIQIGSGNSPQRVTRHVTGLQPGVTYRYRIVATNFVGTATGDPVEFTTKEQSPLPEPPAGRAYELVSPPDKVSGVGVGSWFTGPATSALAGFAAHEGSRFVVQGTYGAVLVDGEFTFVNDWALSERTSEGWKVKPLLSRRAHGSQTIVFFNMQSATNDLALTSWGGTTIKLFAEMEDWVKEVAGATLYLNTWSDGKWEVFGPTTESQGGGPGIASSTALAEDGRSAVASGALPGLAGPGDPTLDISSTTHSVYVDEIPNGLSDSFPGSGVRSVVNVCTPGTLLPARVNVAGAFKQASQPCPPVAPGRDAALISSAGAGLGIDRDGVISSDGSRIFFMSPAPAAQPTPCSGTGQATSCPAQLYVRQRNGDSVVTRWISKTEVTQAKGASADQDATLMGEVIFEGASVDGDKVFFRTNSPLTADDPNGTGLTAPPGGVVAGEPDGSTWDLYMYDMPDVPGSDPADGDLVRISAGPTGGSDCNSPLGGSSGAGALRFSSDDGSMLYFTCAAPLEGVPLASNGTVTTPGGAPLGQSAANLYAYDASKPLSQRWRFVARLPRNTTLGPCASSGSTPGMPLTPETEANVPVVLHSSLSCVRGTPDGSFITFWTDGQLTEDDPDEVTGDVYAYDADLEELTRVSAPQGGVGGSYPCAPGSPIDVRCYGDGGVGLGGAPLPKLGLAETADGKRLAFFVSRSRLVPEDKNDKYDVYQWFAGELSLISTGLSGSHDAFYGGNDMTGTNVYIVTRNRLSWQDKDAVLDVYSARIGNGIPEPPDTSEPCNPVLGECQGPGQTVKPGNTDSDAPTGVNPPAGKRISLTISSLSAKARRKAARTGRLRVRVGATGPSTVTLSATAKLGGKRQVIARAAKRVEKAGRATIVLRLGKAARAKLRAGRSLRVNLNARAAGARPTVSQLSLKR